MNSESERICIVNQLQ